jgi:hypothetical protein
MKMAWMQCRGVRVVVALFALALAACAPEDGWSVLFEVAQQVETDASGASSSPPPPSPVTDSFGGCEAGSTDGGATGFTDAQGDTSETGGAGGATSSPP